ncbi:MAG: hypothetical protein MUO26_00335 [Methanotrichaceae archaeon]|nr:hypothetical protein [Methanotrichaceae archaeon]
MRPPPFFFRVRVVMSGATFFSLFGSSSVGLISTHRLTKKEEGLNGCKYNFTGCCVIWNTDLVDKIDNVEYVVPLETLPDDSKLFLGW